jgi:hypothetical protein
MGMAEDMRKYLTGMGTRAAADLPCVATSNTEAQAQVVVLKDRLWAGFLILFSAGICFLPGSSGHVSAQSWLWRAALWAGIVVAIIAVGRYVRQDFRDYRDPRIRIEIGPDEVVVTGPAGRDARPYAAFASLSVLSSSSTRSVSFHGIGFDTTQGYITLTNDYFQSGRSAAGAILKRMDDLGVELTPYR